MHTCFPEESGSGQEIIFGYGSLLSKSVRAANSAFPCDHIWHTDYLLIILLEGRKKFRCEAQASGRGAGYLQIHAWRRLMHTGKAGELRSE